MGEHETGRMERKAYPSDVRDDEWTFDRMTEDAPHRAHPLPWEVLNGVRWIVWAGAHGLPPCYMVYQQSMRWLRADVCAAIVHDVRAVLRLAQGRTAEPTVAIFDGRMLQSTPESETRAG